MKIVEENHGLLIESNGKMILIAEEGFSSSLSKKPDLLIITEKAFDSNIEKFSQITENILFYGTSS